MERSGGIVYRAGYRVVGPFESAVEIESQSSRLSGNRDVVPPVRLERGGSLFSVAAAEIPRRRTSSVHPEGQFGIGALLVEFESHPLEVVLREYALVHGGNVVEPYPGFYRPIGRSEVLPRMVGKVEKIAGTVETETASSENALSG